jgi:hypothetical protein
MELVYVSLISSIFSIIGLITYFSLSTRKMQLENELNIKRFRIGKRYKIQEMQLPQQVDTRSIKDKTIDNLIQKAAAKYLHTGPEDENEGINVDGIIDGVMQYLEEHPEQKENVGELINKFLSGKKREDEVDVTTLR